VRISDKIKSRIRRPPPTDEELAARGEAEAVPNRAALDRAGDASQAAELERLLGWPVFGDGLERAPDRGPGRA